MEIERNETKIPITRSDYHPIKDCELKQNSPLLFSFLANALEKVGQITGKGSKEKQIIIMANVFRTIILLYPE